MPQTQMVLSMGLQWSWLQAGTTLYGEQKHTQGSLLLLLLLVVKQQTGQDSADVSAQAHSRFSTQQM